LRPGFGPLKPGCDTQYEEFKVGKNEVLLEDMLKALLHNFMPLLVSSMSLDIHNVIGFQDMDNLFKEGI
jgi:lipoxygenase